jgi:hypothetical protein
MLTYRHVNASWLSVAELCRLCRAPLFALPDPLTCIAAPDFRGICGICDIAAVPGNALSFADIRIPFPYRNRQSAFRLRFLASRLRW